MMAHYCCTTSSTYRRLNSNSEWHLPFMGWNFCGYAQINIFLFVSFSLLKPFSAKNTEVRFIYHDVVRGMAVQISRGQKYLCEQI